MSRAAVVAIGAVSPFGLGPSACDVGRVGERAPVAIARDEELASLGFAKPMCARAPASVFDATPGADPAWALLRRALEEALDGLAHAGGRAPKLRVGLSLGTSAGGMRSAERLFAARLADGAAPQALLRDATYFAPFERARAQLVGAGFDVATSAHLVTACAASTIAIGLACEWLHSGEVDLALAGGYDAVGPFVAAGFEALRATTASRPAPFRVGRDGMSLGEGAGVVALVREADLDGRPARFFVSGFGASADAVHVTAPDRTGGGLTRAGRAALDMAGAESGDAFLVSAHATATPFNDAMESRALAALFGEREPVVHPMKAQIGHALGAAGVLETLAIAGALAHGVAPAAAGEGELDPDAPAHLLEVAAPSSARAALKLSAAFGGANAALVIEPPESASRASTRSRRPAYLGALARVTGADVEVVARATGIEPDKVARLDALSLLAATAAARLEPRPGAGAGVIVGHALATVDINERFYARVLARGPTAAEPRLFPPTSPNLVAGQLGILFSWTGPGAAIASGPGGAIDPLAIARTLVEGGIADEIVVVAVDVLGPCSTAIRDGAFAGDETIADGAVAVVVTASPTGRDPLVLPASLEVSGFGHVALARVVEGLTR
jgi:3-oxoacyl-[acyl-carrier-protein] synthase-1/3-oxoacyl-[acyl-carrier-protein] synthase II